MCDATGAKSFTVISGEGFSAADLAGILAMEA